MSAFVDEAQVHARGGDGGAGAVSFRREAHVDRGGPDGGDGGRGGDVWLVATSNLSSLLSYRDFPHRRAENGAHGSGKRRHGARGSDLDALVPVGTVVKGPDGDVLCDLSGAGDRWLAAEGGRGGRGNARFLNNFRRAPAFAEQGELGAERWLDIELKLMADVALVGMPNVGKSTLISSVSAAKPKIADYPFTTLEPHLGVVRVRSATGHSDGRVSDLVVADIPGLIAGAAHGRGLGHRFLRHVERARALVILLDPTASDGIDPERQYEILLDELRRYRADLLDRPRLVVGTKADVVAGDRRAVFGAAPVDVVLSAVTGEGLEMLVARLASLVAAARDQDAIKAERGEVVVHRPVPQGIAVERLSSGCWGVTGRAAYRAVGFSNLNDDGAMAEAMRRLRRLGVDRALARAGARDGDEVQVGDVAFTWYRDGPLSASERSAEGTFAGTERASRAPNGARRRRNAPHSVEGEVE
ncbi:MAG: GTPase ObgE [Actinomycetota bacterium]|nr:GTPase ObgE [Actinomycetota bacterium]